MQSNSIRNAKAFSLSPYICINLEAGQSSKVISFVWCTIVDDAIVCTDLPPLPPDPGTKWKTCKSSSPLLSGLMCFLGKGLRKQKRVDGWQKLAHKNWSSHQATSPAPAQRSLVDERDYTWWRTSLLWSLDDVIVRRKLRILCVNISFRKFDNFWELSQSTKLEMTYHLKLRRRQTCLHQTILCIGILYMLYI